MPVLLKKAPLLAFPHCYLLPFSQSFSISAFRSCSFCKNSFFSFSIFFFVSSRLIVTS